MRPGDARALPPAATPLVAPLALRAFLVRALTAPPFPCENWHVTTGRGKRGKRPSMRRMGDVEGSRHLVGPEAHPLSPTSTAIQSSDGFANGVVVRPSRSHASDPGISDAEDVR